MKPMLGYAGLGLIGMGFPLTQGVISRFGTAGAVAVEAVSLGVLARDLRLVATGAPGTMRRAPAVLLWLETLAAAIAGLLGVLPIVSEGARHRALDRRPVGSEIARRVALGTMFGMRTWRSRIAMQPDHGLRPAA